MKTPCLIPASRYLTRVLAVAFLSAGGLARATSSEIDIVLAVDGIKVVRNLPVLLAEHLGFFKEEGLRITLMETSASAKVDEMLADGRVAGMVAYYHHTIVAQSEGRLCEAVITMAVTPGYELLMASQLKGQVHSLADLKGKRIIAGGPHSAKTTTANLLLLNAGYQLGDYTRFTLSDKTKIAEALKTGEADFVIAPEPDASFYRTQGSASLFADICSVESTKQALGAVFPSTVLYMSTPYAETHPELAQHLVNAFARTLTYINTHTIAEITKLVPEIASGENLQPKVIEQGMKMFACDGMMLDAAARLEAKAISAQFPEYKNVKIETTYTNQFIEKALKK